ncbi:helix-turn-helix domain-containing protein [Pseudarthrobacter polychromogenes]|uniref:HTH cro/C1-type domain-containing protein n=1 Tax=Pseudarthrobacter polychromogenes TaxID=1676 RepID=A0ABQ1XWQ7_9MICC|nr:helix-turn-helix transcriptional regulator [Pseudarthrobacter polychromogenes]GGH04988.1 hypothetical protein GCM10011577_31470 [Pseudarthrobacter polychromogenes]
MTSNSKILEMLGLDLDNPEDLLGVQLAEEDHEFIQELIRMRIKKGLRQADVAAKMRRDPSAVSNFERLGGDPHLSTIRRYAQAVGLRIRHRVEDAEPSARDREVLEYAANVVPLFSKKIGSGSLSAVYSEMEQAEAVL